jgi:hypothetical protein
MAKPVTFPLGRSSRATMLLATGSLTFAKTIGIVRVSRRRAAVAGVPFVTMMSGCKPTNSCASAPIKAPTKVHPHVAAIGPTQVRKRLRERRYAKLPLRIGFIVRHERADAAYPLWLLRARRERPRRRAAEQCDELAPSKANPHLPLLSEGSLSRQNSMAQGCGANLQDEGEGWFTAPRPSPVG